MKSSHTMTNNDKEFFRDPHSRFWITILFISAMDDPIIETKLGKVLGRLVVTVKDFPFYSFQGMRYAEPPLGDLRFRGPKPAKPWDGIWNAQKEGNRSLSFTSDGEIIGDEDCLFINVYTPELPNGSAKPLPVMFYIHGGSCYLGSGNTDLNAPDYLINQEVVIVTFNYRLGALGLLKFKNPKIKAPGNAAFKDMVMALKWVQNNIECFNGDPNNVTVWGQSAGAMSAHLLVVSPMAKGLFHRAIIHSATAFQGFGTPNHLPTVCLYVSRYTGLETQDEFEAYEHLRNLSGEEITRGCMNLVAWTKTRYEMLEGPVIEEPYGQEEPFIDQHPELYFLQKRINEVPIIIGYNSSDAIANASKMYPDGYIHPNIDDVQRVVPLELEFQRDQAVAFGNQIVKFYYGEESPSRRSLDKYIKFQTDMKYNIRLRRSVLLHQYATNLPIYVYQFDFESPQNLYKRLFDMNQPGVCHGDELTYLWHTKYSFRIRPGSAEDHVQHRLVTLWTNFAKTSDPNPEIPDPLIKVKWLPAHNNKVNHLVIGKNLIYKEEGPEPTRMAFWDRLYKSYYRNKYYEIFGEDIDENLLEKIEVQMRLLKFAHLSDKEKQFGFGIRPNC